MATRYATATFRLFVSWALLVGFICTVVPAVLAQEQPVLRISEQGTDEADGRIFDQLDPSRIKTGLLHDRVVSFMNLARYDGTPRASVTTLDSLRQIYHELVRSAVRPDTGLPTLQALSGRAAPYVREEVVPLVVTSIRYDRLKPDALEQKMLRLEGAQLLEAGPASPYETHLAFAAAAFKRQSYDRAVRFVIAPELYLTNHSARASRFEVDFGDGHGPRQVALGEVVTVRYATGGSKTIRLTVYEGNEARHAATQFEVADAAVPVPDKEWLSQTATRSYDGGYASYDAHVFYGHGHEGLTNPIVFVEGFDAYYNDPIKRRSWQDMYLYLAQEGAADAVLARGYDIVLMKLGNTTDYIQRNAFALEHLLSLLEAETGGRDVVVVGPSMGGLIGRYALAFIEREGIPHHVRLLATLDTPHRGANVPLGDQFLIEFFQHDSEKVREGVAALNSISARQQLIYHYRSFPYADPLRQAFVAELEELGYPETRMVLAADGSGHGMAQRGNERVGFRRMAPADQILEYRYRSFFLALDGNVWAVPDTDGDWTQIFQGRKDFIGPHYRARNVYVRGTLPLDNAPGGTLGTQGAIAGADVPFGRIYTSFPEHAWIPTTSALDLPVAHPFYDVDDDPLGLVIAGEAGKKATATAAAIYYPDDNQEHVTVTPSSVSFLLEQVGPAPATAGLLLSALSAEGEGPAYQLSAAYPNPFHTQALFTLSVAAPQEVRVEVYNALGQRVAVLHDGLLAAHEVHRLVFDAAALASGVYLLRAAGETFAATRTLTLFR